MSPCCQLSESKYLDQQDGEVVANDLELAIKKLIKSSGLSPRDADAIRANPCRCECHRFGWTVMH